MKIRTEKIEVPGEQGHYVVREYDDFEFVNPIEQIGSMFISSSMSFERDILVMSGFEGPEEILQGILYKRALKDWKEKFDEYKSVALPDNLYRLLEAKSKKDQVKALKGLSLTTDELIAFFLMAHENYGYKYSQYKAKHYHTGFDEKQLPKLVHLEDDGTLTSIGNTPLTEGQQKQAIDQRKVTISKFIDKENQWHCFFLTYSSLAGKESYKNGQPHLHYISDKWNISRKDVVEQLTSKHYKLPSLPHIDYHRNRNPREDNKSTLPPTQ